MVLSPIGAPVDQLVLERVPDVGLDIIELGGESHFIVSRPGKVDFQNVLSAPGPGSHYDDAVGKVSRLLYAMGDEKHGLPGALPDLQQLSLHQVACLGVER